MLILITPECSHTPLSREQQRIIIKRNSFSQKIEILSKKYPFNVQKIRINDILEYEAMLF